MIHSGSINHPPTVILSAFQSPAIIKQLVLASDARWGYTVNTTHI